MELQHDPNAVSQLLSSAGVNTPPEEIQANQLPDTQNTVADTQLKAANAQHKAVLAAREMVPQPSQSQQIQQVQHLPHPTPAVEPGSPGEPPGIQSGMATATDTGLGGA